ncbi:MAG: MetQ/NlpA family ABC transporter substrate-binding protein [Defluviitaleaceae bacterium]|nr:MetQ/NlpA family ABC transporter substrate-binding protein [Defluviitaleaceae bacterium]
MKKLLSLALCVVLLTLSLTACNNGAATADGDGPVRVRVGATPRPHAEILSYIAPFLLEDGILLEIVEFTEFGMVNPALAQNQLEANFFQHMPFLENFTLQTGNVLHVMGAIHIEPMGAYSMTLSDISQLPYNGLVAIPDCAVNGPRALLLMEQHGILNLDPDAGMRATVDNDIIDNPLSLRFIEIAPALLPRVLLANEADLSIINTNHVLTGAPEINPLEDSLIMEYVEGSPYANMLVVRPEDADNPNMHTLLRHLQSDRVRQFILDNYYGVVPVF